MTRRDFLTQLAVGAACTALPVGCVTAERKLAALRLVQMGDPQFGFCVPQEGASAYRQDVMRFEAAIDRVNDLRPDAVVINGDLVHRAEDLPRDWPRLVRRFDAPVVVSPGNHDLGNRVTRENLARFRRVIGYDRLAMDVKGWRLIVGNSQFWFANDLADETRAYADWVAAECESARQAARPTLLATHYPPFELYLSESDSPRNRPKADRIASVNAWLDAGVRFWLAGHTHTMLSRAHKGLVLLNAETTCRNFDARPFGFRLLSVCADGSWNWEFYAL